MYGSKGNVQTGYIEVEESRLAFFMTYKDG
jgi:hypothetical protein